jgi:hypothetical protein
VGYPNDETYNDWLRLSGFTAELGVGRNEHSATRRGSYERKTPEYWRDALNLAQKEIDAGDAGDDGDAPLLEYQAEEGDPLVTGSAVDALNNAVADVEAESKAADDRLADQRAQLEQTFIDQGFVKSGGEWVDASTLSGDQFPGEEGIDFEGASSGAGSAGGNYPILDVGGFDPALAPGDPGYSYDLFSMASEEDDDAPGTSVLSENLRIEDFESPIAHAKAVKIARDAEEGIRYLKPGDPDYSGAQIALNLQEQTEARQQAKSEEVAKIIADQEYADDIAERNESIRSAIAADIPNPPNVIEAMQMDIPNPPNVVDAAKGLGSFVSAKASALGNITSGIHQALSTAKGAIIDPISERVEEVERGKQEARDAPPTPDPDQRYPEDFAEGGKTSSDRMTLVGEEGPEIALFPDGTEIIPMKRKIKPSQAKRLKKRGVRGMQEGGIVFPGVDDIGDVSGVDTSGYGGSLPSGVRRTIAGQSIAPSRGYLSRAAGITLPSGQAMRNMLPEEMDVLQDVAAQTRIPERAFQRELALGIPSGQRGRGSARFLPLSLR